MINDLRKYLPGIVKYLSITVTVKFEKKQSLN